MGIFIVSIAAGILIQTLFGPKRVEDLLPEEFVLADGGMPRPLLALVTKRVRPNRDEGPLIMIRPGALGRGCPARAMIVSPGQVIEHSDTRRAAAQHFVDGRRILRVWPQRGVLLYQPVLADAAPFTANGARLFSPRLSPDLTQRLIARLPKRVAPVALPVPERRMGV